MAKKKKTNVKYKPYNLPRDAGLVPGVRLRSTQPGGKGPTTEFVSDSKPKPKTKPKLKNRIGKRLSIPTPDPRPFENTARILQGGSKEKTPRKVIPTPDPKPFENTARILQGGNRPKFNRVKSKTRQKDEPKSKVGPEPKGKVKAKPGAKVTKIAPLGKVVERFTGNDYPSNPTMVRKFLADLGVISSANDLPNKQAQLIANKIGVLPSEVQKEALTQIGAGLRETAKTMKGVKGPARIAEILRFFEIKGGPIRAAGRAVGGAIRAASRHPLGAAAALLAGGALAFGGEEKEPQTDLSPEDYVNEKLLEEYQLRSRLRKSGEAGAPSAALQALLEQQQNPFGAVSVPPSSGFPVR